MSDAVAVAAQALPADAEVGKQAGDPTIVGGEAALAAVWGDMWEMRQVWGRQREARRRAAAAAPPMMTGANGMAPELSPAKRAAWLSQAERARLLRVQALQALGGGEAAEKEVGAAEAQVAQWLAAPDDVLPREVDFRRTRSSTLSSEEEEDDLFHDIQEGEGEAIVARTVGLLNGPGAELNWSPRVGAPPRVRGATYLKDNVKQPSAPPRMAFIGAFDRQLAPSASAVATAVLYCPQCKCRPDRRCPGWVNFVLWAYLGSWAIRAG
jgi:hypothetical protein